MAKEATITVPVQLSFQESVFELLKQMAADGDVSTRLRDWAIWCLRNLATGGVMLTAEQIQILENTAGIQVKTANDVISAVQEAKGRSNGQNTVKVEIDSSWYPALRELASIRDETPDELMTEVIRMGVAQGWAHQISPETVIFLGDDVATKLRGHFGKKVISGDDLLLLIDGQEAAA